MLRLPSFRFRCGMRMDGANVLPLLCALVIGGLAPAGVPAQHVHGVIELGIVVEGDTVAVSLRAPLDDVVGFEHAPESDEQRERIRQAAAMLSNADAMFGLAGSASCSTSDTSVDGPAYVTEHFAEGEAGSAGSHDGHHHDADHDDSEHHDSEHHDSDHHDSDHHDADHGDSGHHDADHHDAEHHDSEQHSEVNASYEWACGNVSALDSLALRFTEGFAGVETIEIQILTPAGAQVITAQGRAASVSLTPP